MNTKNKTQRTACHNALVRQYVLVLKNIVIFKCAVIRISNFFFQPKHPPRLVFDAIISPYRRYNLHSILIIIADVDKHPKSLLFPFKTSGLLSGTRTNFASPVTKCRIKNLKKWPFYHNVCMYCIICIVIIRAKILSIFPQYYLTIRGSIGTYIYTVTIGLHRQTSPVFVTGPLLSPFNFPPSPIQ